MQSYKNSDPRPPIMQGAPPPPDQRPPLIDWDRPPWNRWTFQHVREFLPTADVPRGAGPVRDLPQASVDVDDIRFETEHGGEITVAQLLDDTYTDGFLILKGGRVRHESYWNGMTPRTPHLSQSMAKSVTAIAAGVMIGDGRLDPQAPVTEYLPELEATAYKGAKLQHVLDMTSGVRFSEAYTDPLSDIGKMDVASGWKPIPPDAPADADWPSCVWDQILSLTTLEAEHGARFEYRSIETDVLAHCMERVSGQRLSPLIGGLLWSRIGAEDSAYFTVDPAGYALACGGFNATLRDYARFGLLVLEGGAWNGAQIVPREWIDDCMAGPHGLANDLLRSVMPQGRYRNQFWVENADGRTIVCRGVFGQMIYIAPELDLVAVKLSTWPEFRNPTHDINTRRAIKAIAAALD